MYSTLQKKFADAVAKKAVVFTPSTEVRNKLPSGVELVYTVAPALEKKPKAADDNAADGNAGDKTAKAGFNPKHSPWLPVDEDLLVEKREQYSVVLNKFAVTKDHFLLVTNEFQRQTAPLSESDWEQAIAVLQEVNKESGKRHIGFFNSGSQSGASVAHKHIQFMALPDNFRPFPDTTKGVSPTEAVADERIPFAHYISGIAAGATGEDVTLRYADLLGRVLTIVSRANPGKKRPDINYNLVFTEDWLMLTPRQKEATDNGISINALGTVGLMLAKNEEQLEYEKDRAFDIVLDLGFPYEEVRPYDPNQTGYTHY